MEHVVYLNQVSREEGGSGLGKGQKVGSGSLHSVLLCSPDAFLTSQAHEKIVAELAICPSVSLFSFGASGGRNELTLP